MQENAGLAAFLTANVQTRQRDPVHQPAVQPVLGTNTKGIVAPCRLQMGTIPPTIQESPRHRSRLASGTLAVRPSSAIRTSGTTTNGRRLEAAQKCPQDHRIERGRPQVRQAANQLGSRMLYSSSGRVTWLHSRAESVGSAA